MGVTARLHHGWVTHANKVSNCCSWQKTTHSSLLFWVWLLNNQPDLEIKLE